MSSSARTGDSRLGIFGRVLRWAHLDPPLLAGIAAILALCDAGALQRLRAECWR